MLRSSALSGIAVVIALSLSSLVASAQRVQDRDRPQPFTRLEPGMTISVRMNAPIDAARTDYRVYSGIVDQDVRGDDGRVAIPRGSAAELIVRRARNDEMILDLESVMVNGQRYGVSTDPNRIVGTAGHDGLIGSIVGAISGGQARGEAVRIPRHAVMNFRLERPLDVGVPDRGVMRNGNHYHDYYGRDSNGRGRQ